MNDDQEYGMGFSKIATLMAWMPVLMKLEAIADAKNPVDRAQAIVAALKAAAAKTDSKTDDSVLDHVEKILVTPEGAAFVEWFSRVMEAVK